MPTDARSRKPAAEQAQSRVPEILDVAMAAAFLTVSRDTVYHLFQSGQLPGRKVGRKWVTTKAAVIRWIEQSSADDALARAMKRGDGQAIANAINTGKARIRSNPRL